MSKIKDLYAEAEGIDDLMPTKPSMSTIAKAVANSCRSVATEDEIANEAEFEVSIDDDGHECVYVENFMDICESIAREHLDDMIEQNHIDLTDTEYFNTLDLARDMLADDYAGYESQLCEDFEQDNKYKLDEVRERNGNC